MKVTVPVGALAEVADEASVASHVVEYTDAGPLFFTADETPEGSAAATKLRTSLLSVMFTDAESGEELRVRGLAAPFLVTLSLPASHSGNRTNESAGCAYWNTTLEAWVHETEPVARCATGAAVALAPSLRNGFRKYAIRDSPYKTNTRGAWR